MTAPQMQPSFWDSFKDPRFLITMAAIVATGGVAYYRLGQVEHNQQDAVIEFEEFQKELEIEIKESRKNTDTRLVYLEGQMRMPRFTVIDFDTKMSEFKETNQKELDRRQRWMDDQNSFRLQMVEFVTESKAATREFRGLIQELKDSKKGSE